MSSIDEPGLQSEIKKMKEFINADEDSKDISNNLSSNKPSSETEQKLQSMQIM